VVEHREEVVILEVVELVLVEHLGDGTSFRYKTRCNGRLLVDLMSVPRLPRLRSQMEGEAEGR